MAKIRPVRAKQSRPPVPKQQAISCVVILLGGILLLFLMIFAMFRSS